MENSRKIADLPPRAWGERCWANVGVLMSLAALGIALASCDRGAPPAPVAETPPDAAPGAEAAAKPLAADAPASDLVDDDGRTPWVSPTQGSPLDLAGLPPGVQVIVALRPRALLAHPEAEKIVAALGPLGTTALEQSEAAVDRPPGEVDRLLIGWQIERDGRWTATFVARSSSSPPPPLPRDLERLVAHTDSDRQFTVLFRPSSLFGDANAVFAGPMAAFRGPLFWFFGDGLAAASVSLHWNENFFVELLGVPTLDAPPERMATELMARVEEMPIRVAAFAGTLGASPHAEEIVARLPVMLRTLAAYTRSRYDRELVELRAYLPAAAGHNLLMGAELAVAEAAAANGVGAPHAPVAEATSPRSVGERLNTVTSLRFTRDTLETALRMLSDDVGVPIVIRGSDLQSDGITKNQSFGIDVADRPAAEILVEILRLANPDKLATGPADPRQKLVYVVGRESAGGPEVVFVTTRSRAVERGETLPAAFAASQ